MICEIACVATGSRQPGAVESGQKNGPEPVREHQPGPSPTAGTSNGRGALMVPDYPRAMRSRVHINDVSIDGPEMAAISDAAFRLWVQTICWATRHGRADVIPESVCRYYSRRRWMSLATELVDQGLWTECEFPLTGFIANRFVRGFEIWRPGALEPGRRPIQPELRRAVYERDGFQCLHCGSEENLSLDHIHPYSRGGEDTYENLQTLCRSCNSRKGARV